jgi:hypothetical protein
LHRRWHANAYRDAAQHGYANQDADGHLYPA